MKQFRHKGFQTVFLIIAWGLLWGIPRGYAHASQPAPKMVIDRTTVEFAPVIAGSDVTHVFHIQNKGDAVLNIAGVHTQ